MFLSASRGKLGLVKPLKPLLLSTVLTLALSAPVAALAKRVSVEGVVVLTDGKPAAHAEIIIKDSWAGLFVMRERELSRVRTDSEGRFAVELRYRHTLDFYVPARECEWWVGNKRIQPGDRGADGIYRPRFVLLADDECNRTATN